MKNIRIYIVFASICLLSTNCAQAQEKYYYAFDEKIYLNEVPNKFVISFDKRYLLDIQDSLLKNAQVRHIELKKENSCYILTIENTNIKTLRKEFSQQVGIKSINPMYVIADAALEMGVTDAIVVQFKENVSQQAINEIHKKYNVGVKEISKYHQLLSIPIAFDPLEVANAYQTSGIVSKTTRPIFWQSILFV